MEFAIRVLIRNGIVVNTDGQTKRDLLIESGTVRQLGNSISPQFPYGEIDATNCYAFPDGVDVHTHFNIDVGITCSCDDFLTDTRAAACSDTTTIVDHMGSGPNGCRLRHQLEVCRGYAVHKVVISYSFHSMIQHINYTILDEIPMIVREGLSGSKFYLTYQCRLNNGEILQALRRLHESGTLTTVHPENDAAIVSKQVEFIVTGLAMLRYHVLSRPLECGVEAIARMINLTQIVGNAPLYIMCLSNGLGLDYLRLTRTNHQPAWAETCPQHLLLDECSCDAKGGTKFILSPSLRNVREQDKLWCGTSDDTIDVMVTDHCTFSMTKCLQISKGSFSRCPSSLPGVEDRMQLLFSSGMIAGRTTPECFIKLTSVMPTRLFGLWPRKGLLTPGSDGDMVTIDPRQSQQIQYRYLHDNVDYSPWESFTCRGMIVGTLSRGETIFCDGTFTGEAGWGCFLWREPLISPVF